LDTLAAAAVPLGMENMDAEAVQAAAVLTAAGLNGLDQAPAQQTPVEVQPTREQGACVECRRAKVKVSSSYQLRYLETNVIA
jgi:hypothetical protein